MGQVGTERLPLWQLLLCHAHTLCSPDQRRLGCVSFNSDKLWSIIFDQDLYILQHTPRFNVVNLWGPRTNPMVQNWALNILHCLLRCLSLLLCQHLRCLDHRHLQRAGRGRAWGRHGQEPEVLHWFCHPREVFLFKYDIRASFFLQIWHLLRIFYNNVISPRTIKDPIQTTLIHKSFTCVHHSSKAILYVYIFEKAKNHVNIFHQAAWTLCARWDFRAKVGTIMIKTCEWSDDMRLFLRKDWHPIYLIYQVISDYPNHIFTKYLNGQISPNIGMLRKTEIIKLS